MSGDHDEERIPLVTECLMPAARSELLIAGGFPFAPASPLVQVHVLCIYRNRTSAHRHSSVYTTVPLQIKAVVV
jgi:hypothetical protein